MADENPTAPPEVPNHPVPSPDPAPPPPAAPPAAALVVAGTKNERELELERKLEAESERARKAEIIAAEWQDKATKLPPIPAAAKKVKRVQHWSDPVFSQDEDEE